MKYGDLANDRKGSKAAFPANMAWMTVNGGTADAQNPLFPVLSDRNVPEVDVSPA